MAMILNPYLTFEGNAEEEMRFFGEVLGGEVTVSKGSTDQCCSERGRAGRDELQGQSSGL